MFEKGLVERKLFVVYHLKFVKGSIRVPPNGSGKTTTIRMMTGLISMTEGDITICGHSIRTEREKALEQIGAIVENPELYDYMTGMQNLKHFANMAITPISKERIAEIVKLVELEHAIHKK